MPKGMTFDRVGNMAAVNIGADTVLADLHEHIGCNYAIPLYIRPGLMLWVDAEGADNEPGINVPLTQVVEALGYDSGGVYGAGVFLGADGRGEDATALSLSPDERLEIVLTRIRLPEPSNH